MRTNYVNPGLSLPPQGDFSFHPGVVIFTDPTPSGLEDQLNAALQGKGSDATADWRVESIQYQMSQGPGMLMVYSALVHYTEAQRI